MINHTSHNTHCIMNPFLLIVGLYYGFHIILFSYDLCCRNRNRNRIRIRNRNIKCCCKQSNLILYRTIKHIYQPIQLSTIKEDTDTDTDEADIWLNQLENTILHQSTNHYPQSSNHPLHHM